MQGLLSVVLVWEGEKKSPQLKPILVVANHDLNSACLGSSNKCTFSLYWIDLHLWLNLTSKIDCKKSLHGTFKLKLWAFGATYVVLLNILEMQVYPAWSHLFLHTVSSSYSAREYDGIHQLSLILREFKCWSLLLKSSLSRSVAKMIWNVKQVGMTLSTVASFFQVCFCNEWQT